VNKVGYGSLVQTNPINSQQNNSISQGMSGFWGGLSANGSTEVLYNLVDNKKDTYQIT